MTRALYLVTGGAGFIGSHIVAELRQRGQGVRVLDNFSTGKREHVADLPGVELFEGDIRDPATCAGAVKGAQFVLHLAAVPSVARSVEDPQTSHDVNVNGTFNMLMAARAAGVQRFVYSSSSSVYGDNPELPKDESMRPNPLSPYAVSKLAAEHYTTVFASLYDLPTVSLRYFNVFGPRQDPASQYSAVIPKFVTAILKGEVPVIHGDGLQTRDFTYVANVVHANLLACTTPVTGPIVVNIGAGQRVSLLELIAQIEKLTGRRARPEYAPPRPGDVRDSLAAITRAKDAIGYRPMVDFASGLAETVKYFENDGRE